MNEYSLFVQDSWRVTPTLTLNGGLRWDVQMPFSADERHHVAVDLRGCLRHLRDWRRRALPVLRSPARRRQVSRRSSSSTKGVAGLQHRLEQLRAERRRRVAAERAGRLAADDPRRSRAGDAARRLLGRLRPRRAWRSSPGQYGAESRQPRSASRARNANGNCSCRASSLAAAASARTSRLGPPRSTHSRGRRDASGDLHAVVSDRGAPAAPTTSTSSARHPGRVRADLHRRASSASLSRDMAIDIRYVGTRGVEPVDRRELTTRSTSSRTASSTSSSWRWRTCRPTSRPARGATFAVLGPARARRRCRFTWPTSTARATSSNPAAYTGTNWTNTTFVGRLAAPNPNPTERGQRPRRQRRRVAPTPLAAGLPANFFVVNPDVGRRQHVYDEQRVQRLRRAADRAAAPAVARLPDQRQLPVRARERLRVPRTALRPRARTRPPTCGTRSRCSGTGACRSAAAAASAPT